MTTRPHNTWEVQGPRFSPAHLWEAGRQEGTSPGGAQGWGSMASGFLCREHLQQLCSAPTQPGHGLKQLCLAQRPSEFPRPECRLLPVAGWAPCPAAASATSPVLQVWPLAAAASIFFIRNEISVHDWTSPLGSI